VRSESAAQQGGVQFGVPLCGCSNTPPALHHIGRIMKEAGYSAVRRAGRRGYLVVRPDSEHIEAARRILGREGE